MLRQVLFHLSACGRGAFQCYHILGFPKVQQHCLSLAACFTARHYSEFSKVSRWLLSKADVERLKSPALRDVVLTAEKLLSLNHDVLQKQAFAKTAEGLSLMGRCMVRTCLHLCKKQAKGRDTKEYQDLAEISALFGSELLAIKDGKSFLASSPEAPEEAAAVKPQTLQDCCCIPVQVCLFFLGLLQGKQFDSSLKQSTQC